MQLVGRGDDEGDGGDEHLGGEACTAAWHLTMERENRARNCARLLGVLWVTTENSKLSESA